MTKKTGPTLGLAMIMKDEVDDLSRIIDDYGRFFDKIYVTVTDAKTHDTLKKHFTDTPNKKVKLSYFKWINHFGKARLYNQKQIKTDYWMWIDLDDEIRNAENIPSVVNHMVMNGLDVVWFQYDYLPRVNLSDPESISWRERIVKSAPNLAWNDVAVHETLNESIQGDIKEELISDVVIKHRKAIEKFAASQDRNKSILEAEWQKAPSDAVGYYLGRILREEGDYIGAIEKLSYAAFHSDIKPIRFGAWQGIGDCYFQVGNYTDALAAVDNLISVEGNHPEPWYQAYQVYKAMGYLNTALYFAEIAMSKKPQGNLDLVAKDPSLFQYKYPFEVAQLYLSTHNSDRAYQLYRSVKEIAPEYIEEQSAASDVRFDEVFGTAYAEFRERSPLSTQNRLNDLRLLVHNARAEGKSMEGSADIDELNYLANLTRLPGIKTIGEIGFNAGMSSYAFLFANPETKVISFDLGEHEYVQDAKKIIDEQFPNRHKLVLGDSTKTVPEYHKAHPKLKFDLIFVDGGHDFEIAKADLENMKKFATKDTILVTDDLTPWLPWGIGPTRAWTEAIKKGMVIQDELIKDGMVVERIQPPGDRVYVRGRYADPNLSTLGEDF